jgi:hypothetical protein
MAPHLSIQASQQDRITHILDLAPILFACIQFQHMETTPLAAKMGHFSMAQNMKTQVL